MLEPVPRSTGQEPAKQQPDRVVATVEGQSIRSSDLQRELAIAFPNRTFPPNELAAIEKSTLEQLVRRELVLCHLRNSKQLATDAEVDVAVDRLKKRLSQQEQSFEEYLATRKLTEESLQRSLRWQLSWSRMLERYLTDSNLQTFFEKHRRDFDGTQIRVAHILFKVPEGSDSATADAARQKAIDVHGQLRKGQLDFTEAAKRYSAGATKDEGGDIGFIERREPMPEAFSRAAFALEVNQLSDPVETAFGFHIIKCLEIRPGQKRWNDVRAELEPAVAEYLFNWASDQARRTAKVELPQ